MDTNYNIWGESHRIKSHAWKGVSQLCAQLMCVAGAGSRVVPHAGESGDAICTLGPCAVRN